VPSNVRPWKRFIVAIVVVCVAIWNSGATSPASAIGPGGA